MCQCFQGRALGTDGQTCAGNFNTINNIMSASIPLFTLADINECLEDNGNCEDICINTEGSFTCQCFQGRVLAANNRSCEGSYSEPFLYTIDYSMQI